MLTMGRRADHMFKLPSFLVVASWGSFLFAEKESRKA
jgi:hypothetical protein